MNIFKKISIFALLSFLVIFPVFVSADTPANPPKSTQITGTISNPFKGGNDLMSFISTILNNVVMPIAAVAVVIWIVWAGFAFVLAQGKEAEITKAKQRLLWSLIGAGILLGAVAIAEVVKNTVGALISTT